MNFISLLARAAFPRAYQPLGHAFPALSRARVRLTSVLLDQRPTVLTLPTRLRCPATRFARTSFLARRTCPANLCPPWNVAKLKSVWAIYQDIESRHPRGTLMDLPEIFHESGLMKS